MPRLVVDREACIGCGTCVELCPEVFDSMMKKNPLSRTKRPAQFVIARRP
ncbi:ferredoxin [Thermosulfuriphilus sp.]